MNTYHAAFWSMPSDESRNRTTHHQRTKQCGQEEWTWEEILDWKGPWAQAGEYHCPKEEMEAAKVERRRYEELAQRGKHKRQLPKTFFGGGTQGDWRGQGSDLSQLPVVTVGSE
jgi:hypothetical protein